MTDGDRLAPDETVGGERQVCYSILQRQLDSITSAGYNLGLWQTCNSTPTVLLRDQSQIGNMRACVQLTRTCVCAVCQELEKVAEQVASHGQRDGQMPRCQVGAGVGHVHHALHSMFVGTQTHHAHKNQVIF